MTKVLIPVSNHATLGETDQPNGTYAPELTHVIDVLSQHGLEYDIASIKGGEVPLYGLDVENDDINRRVLSDPGVSSQLSKTLGVNDINIEDYDAIFYPGGFGLLSDLANNKEFAALAAKHYEAGGIIAAVCHGPAALLPITLSSGDKLLSSKSVTGFTREEEIDFGTINDIPFLLEEALTRGSARYNKVQPWQELVVVDGRVITGQNPASAHKVGVTLAELLNNQ
ncbi:type 1 glutamine amidotransferase domain-containing protein [Pleionea sediminis]|uniref:type 1 glutamine amidotransferase domain-containing protein n=1 Tax=Pleionea sediminis TaxID=2569479 RepID=UPI00118500B4|nr:type 1 glutamine amidotransferase domain-containing protein [Pleionea sediminis]